MRQHSTAQHLKYSKEASVTNEINSTVILFSFDTIFIFLSLMVVWVFPAVTEKFTSGDRWCADSNLAPPAFHLRKGSKFLSQVRSP